MKQTTKRFLSMIAGLVFLVSSLVIYFEFITPVYVEVQEIKGKQIGSRLFLLDEQATIEKVRDLISSYQGQTKVQEVVSLALPLEEDVNGAVAQVYGLSEHSGLAMKSVSVSTAGDRNVSAGFGDGTSFSLQKPVGSVTLILALNGSYESLKEFLSLLETNIRVFDVVSISLTEVSAGDAPSGLFDYGLTAVAYYQR